MDDPVGLENPAGLRLDDVDRLASGSGGGPIAQCGSAELVCVAGFVVSRSVSESFTSTVWATVATERTTEIVCGSSERISISEL